MTEALFWGAVCGVSLPLGAIAALYWTPSHRLSSMLLAFGAGALLAATAVELIGGAVTPEALRHGEIYPVAAGCIVGALIFMALNHVVNKRGGFLRKGSTAFNHVRRKKLHEIKTVIRELSRAPLFQELPASEIHHLAPFLSNRSYAQGATLMRQGDPGDSLFIITRGKVAVIDERGGNQQLATLAAGDVVGEIALVTGEVRSASAVALEETKVWMLLKEHFDEVVKGSPKLGGAVRDLALHRITDLQRRQAVSPERAERWFAQAAARIPESAMTPTAADIRQAAAEHGNAPVTIWLGNLLDCIPEAVVIGSGLIHGPVSFPLVGGIFMANFPEALAASVGMKEHKFTRSRIISMWGSLMILTAVCSAFGFTAFSGAPHLLFAFIEGIAAGAILVMVAETMLPEAVHKGGNGIGLATLVGFLAAVFMKTLGE